MLFLGNLHTLGLHGMQNRSAFVTNSILNPSQTIWATLSVTIEEGEIKKVSLRFFSSCVLIDLALCTTTVVFLVQEAHKMNYYLNWPFLKVQMP